MRLQFSRVRQVIESSPYCGDRGMMRLLFAEDGLRTKVPWGIGYEYTKVLILAGRADLVSPFGGISWKSQGWNWSGNRQW